MSLLCICKLNSYQGCCVLQVDVGYSVYCLCYCGRHYDEDCVAQV
jgi:hypothetical protein